MLFYSQRRETTVTIVSVNPDNWLASPWHITTLVELLWLHNSPWYYIFNLHL
jgi:DICT domain-containing protein